MSFRSSWLPSLCRRDQKRDRGSKFGKLRSIVTCVILNGTQVALALMERNIEIGFSIEKILMVFFLNMSYTLSSDYKLGNVETVTKKFEIDGIFLSHE